MLHMFFFHQLFKIHDLMLAQPERLIRLTWLASVQLTAVDMSNNHLSGGLPGSWSTLTTVILFTCICMATWLMGWGVAYWHT